MAGKKALSNPLMNGGISLDLQAFDAIGAISTPVNGAEKAIPVEKPRETPVEPLAPLAETREDIRIEKAVANLAKETGWGKANNIALIPARRRTVGKQLTNVTMRIDASDYNTFRSYANDRNLPLHEVLHEAAVALRRAKGISMPKEG